MPAERNPTETREYRTIDIVIYRRGNRRGKGRQRIVMVVVVVVVVAVVV